MGKTFLKGSFLKELLIATIFVFMCTSIVSFVLYSHYFKLAMMKTNEDKLESDSSLVIEMIQSQINQLQIHANSLGTNTNIANHLKRYMYDPDNLLYYTEFESQVIEELNQIYLLFSDIIDSSVYIARNSIFVNYQLYERQDDEPDKFRDYLYNKMEGEDFMSILPAMENPVLSSENLVIPIVFRYEPFNRDTSFLVSFISCQKLAKVVANTFLSYFDGIIISDEKSNTIYSSGIVGPTKNATTMDTYFPLTGWKIKLIKDNSDWESTIRNFVFIEIIWFFLILSFSILIIYSVYMRFTKPLKKLVTKMLSNSKNGKYEHFSYQKQNEIGALSHCYNEVIDEVENLVMTLNEKIEELEGEKKQREWEEELKRRAEIKALQAQINPHFLYNALNSIVWIATDNNDEKAAEFTLHLAAYYHTSLSRGEDAIKLEDEISHSLDYLYLQGHRYDKIAYSIKVDPSIRHTMVPKIIIQPLIENAIYHGLKVKDSMIWILAINIYRCKDKIIISVYDNGIGIQRNKLETICNNLHDGIVDSSSGYGIYNVNNRIKLTYGKEYGLKLYSTERRYTLSVIELPFKKNEHTDSR